MPAYETRHTDVRRSTRRGGWATGPVVAAALLGVTLATTASGLENAVANAPASASEPAAIVVPGDVRYCSQQSILIRYRWTGPSPKGVQMWISLDGTQWLPWAWSNSPAEGFTFTPPRQAKVLIALAPAAEQAAILPDSGYQSLAIVFDWDKPLLRLISSQLLTTAGGTSLRLSWAAYDENLGERPISLHWRHAAGEPWQQAATDLPNSGAFDWPIPLPLTGKGFEVSLRATDLAGNTAEAVLSVPAKAGEAPARNPAATASASNAAVAATSRPVDPGAPTLGAAEAERLCLLAQLRMAQNEFGAAEDLFREAIQSDPTCYAARLNLGILLQRRGRHAEAIGEYQAVLALKPDNVTAWRNLALAYMSIKDNPKARITLQKLLAVEPNNPQTWIDLGDVEMLMGRPETARKFWEEAQSVSKPNSETAARAAKRLRAYARTK